MREHRNIILQIILIVPEVVRDFALGVQDVLVDVKMSVLDVRAVRVVRAHARMVVQGLVRAAVQGAVKKVVRVFVQMVARTNARAAA